MTHSIEVDPFKVAIVVTVANPVDMVTPMEEAEVAMVAMPHHMEVPEVAAMVVAKCSRDQEATLMREPSSLETSALTSRSKMLARSSEKIDLTQ